MYICICICIWGGAGNAYKIQHGAQNVEAPVFLYFAGLGSNLRVLRSSVLQIKDRAA